MANDIPIFKTETQNTVASITSEAPKSVDEITATIRGEYVAAGSETTEQPKIRKKRSDAGMPRGSRKTLGANTAQGQTVGGSDAGQNLGYTIDKAIVEKTAKTVLNTVDGIFVRRIGSTVFQLTKDNALAKEMSSEAGLSVSEADLMSELTGIIFEKHGLLTGYAPEILLGIMLTGWATRVTLVMGRLNAIVKEMKKAKVENVSSPSTDKNSNHREIG